MVVTDLRMPGMDGLELLDEIAQRWPDDPGDPADRARHASPLAVEAMKRGAADFMLKPFDREEILFTVRKALAGARHAERQPPPTDAAAGAVGSQLAGDARGAGR